MAKSGTGVPDSPWLSGFTQVTGRVTTVIGDIAKEQAARDEAIKASEARQEALQQELGTLLATLKTDYGQNRVTLGKILGQSPAAVDQLLKKAETPVAKKPDKQDKPAVTVEETGAGDASTSEGEWDHGIG